MRRPPQRGAALGIVLLLLLGLALLALAGSAAAIAALALAGLDEQRALAFEAAEAGISRALRALAAGAAVPTGPVTLVPWPDIAGHATVRIEVREDELARTGLAAGFSLGTGPETYGVRRLIVVSDGRAARGAAVRLEQGVVVYASTAEAAP